MTRYIKHYYVDGENLTEYFTDRNMGPNGKTHPRLDGLDVKFWFVDSNGIDYCLSLVPDTTTITPVAGLAELSYADWAAQVQDQFDLQRSAVTADAVRLSQIGKTAEQVQAMTLDTASADSMVASFQQFSAPAR